MDTKFKWNMFITSFIPLWVSIVISDVWNIIENVMKTYGSCNGDFPNYGEILLDNIVSIVVVVVILILMIISVSSLNSFLNDKRSNSEPPKIKIKRAIRANKLSSEFLLAYILPMIAFDFAEFKSVILFAIYFAMLAFLCIRNNNVYTNILLEFKGYKMYMCNLETSRLGRIYIYEDCLVLSKDNLTVKRDNDIEYWDFDNYIYIDLK